MKRLLQLEEMCMLAVSVYALYILNAHWWIYLLLLLGPDISMLGYIAGNKTGAVTYNLFHHKGIAVAFFLSGIIFYIDNLVIIALVLFGHSCMDRMLGYGLKYVTGFQFTHLGQIGNAKHKNNQ